MWNGCLGVIEVFDHAVDPEDGTKPLKSDSCRFRLPPRHSSAY